jgi:hypothetical protein
MSESKHLKDLLARRKELRQQLRSIYSAERLRVAPATNEDKKGGVTVAPRTRSAVASVDAIAEEIAAINDELFRV